MGDAEPHPNNDEPFLNLESNSKQYEYKSRKVAPAKKSIYEKLNELVESTRCHSKGNEESHYSFTFSSGFLSQGKGSQSGLILPTGSLDNQTKKSNPLELDRLTNNEKKELKESNPFEFDQDVDYSYSNNDFLGSNDSTVSQMLPNLPIQSNETLEIHSATENSSNK